jgi:hypothetical protein
MNSHEDRMSKKTAPDQVAELAADIIELIGKRQVLIAEGLMALFLAVNWQASNCSCDYNCGEIAFERARKEIREATGMAASRLFDLEMEARDG